MLTIDQLVKIDNLATRIITAMHRFIARMGHACDDLLVDAAYRVVEAKAAAIGKAEDKISNLEDARSELVAHGVEAKAVLRENYKAALAALDKELAAKGDKLDSALAEAALKVLTAEDQYEAVVAQVREKLGVEVDA